MKGAGNLHRTVFACVVCHTRWTAPLRRMPPWPVGSSTELCAVVPTGWWTLHDDPRARPGRPAAVNPHDVKNIIPHDDIARRVGCCGVSYREAMPNLRCARCGAEAGYELTDGDHCYHAVFFSREGCVEVPCEEPDDATLNARFMARRNAQTEPMEDVGMAGVSPSLTVDLDAVWSDDTPSVELFPELESFAARVAGLEVRVCLNGVWVRPQWPEGERVRLIALDAVPRGRSHDPLFWWTDVPLAQGVHDRHQWHQWCVDAQVCVVWERWPEGSSARATRVAFRVPWERWRDAWREALGG